MSPCCGNKNHQSKSIRRACDPKLIEGRTGRKYAHIVIADTISVPEPIGGVFAGTRQESRVSPQCDWLLSLFRHSIFVGVARDRPEGQQNIGHLDLQRIIGRRAPKTVPPKIAPNARSRCNATNGRRPHARVTDDVRRSSDGAAALRSHHLHDPW